MTNQTGPILPRALRSKRNRKRLRFVYDQNGVSNEVPNLYAGVCPIDGEVSFTPDTTDELMETVRDLVTPGKRSRERRSMSTEYIFRVAFRQINRPQTAPTV